MTRIGWFVLVLGALWVAAAISSRGAEPLGAALTAQPAEGGIAPVPLPDPGIPGFKFPEDEATILTWVKNNNQHSINKHAWGIWTALNMPSGESFEGQDLSVLQTWVTPQDILELGPAALARSRRDPRALTFLRQLRTNPSREPPGQGWAPPGSATSRSWGSSNSIPRRPSISPPMDYFPWPS